MATGDLTGPATRRWYQMTWLWIGVAFLGIPFTVTWFVVMSFFSEPDIVYWLGILAITALMPIGLWMGALVTKRVWARILLSIAIVPLFFFAAWVAFEVGQNFESDVIEACQKFTTADGEEFVGNAELCETSYDGTFNAFMRGFWISFALGIGFLWFVPLVVLYILRRRFQPEEAMTGKLRRAAEVAGLVLVTLGGLFVGLITVLLIQDY